MDLTFRETLPSDVGELFSVRARTRENPISSEQLAELGITPEVIAGHIAGGRIKGWVCSQEDRPSCFGYALCRRLDDHSGGL